MGKVKNNFGEARDVAELGWRRVEPGQVIEVPDDRVFGFTVQEGWDPVGSATEALHEAGAAEQAAAQMVDYADGLPIPEPESDAPREEWAGYALAAELATPDEIAGKGRDDLVGEFSETSPIGTGDVPLGQPADDALKADWEAYARTLGATDEDLAGKTKADLIAAYGKES